MEQEIDKEKEERKKTKNQRYKWIKREERKDKTDDCCSIGKKA